MKKMKKNKLLEQQKKLLEQQNDELNKLLEQKKNKMKIYFGIL